MTKFTRIQHVFAKTFVTREDNYLHIRTKYGGGYLLTNLCKYDEVKIEQMKVFREKRIREYGSCCDKGM